VSDKILEVAKKALEEGRPLDTIAALEPLVEEDDENVDALVVLGMAYVQAEMPKKAVEILEIADEQVEQHCVVELFLGRALWALGKTASAEDHLREALRLDPDEPEPWIDLSRILFQAHQYREAMVTLDDALKRYPEDIHLLFLHSLVAYRHGDFTLAAKQFAKLHKIAPELITCTSNYAYVLLIQKHTEEAIPFVSFVNNMDPEDFRSMILMGELCYQSGEYDKAMESFGKVLDKDPINSEALAKLALISKHLDDDISSREYLNRAEMELGKDTESWRCLCETYSKLGMSDEYLDCLKRWTKADKKAAAPWVVLASTYYQRGDMKQSELAWQQAFRLRGYVKIRCPGCKTERRLHYDESKEFDINKDIQCDSCSTVISMPEGLATD